MMLAFQNYLQTMLSTSNVGQTSMTDSGEMITSPGQSSSQDSSIVFAAILLIAVFTFFLRYAQRNERQQNRLQNVSKL